MRGLQFNERDVTQIPAEELLRIDIYWSASMGLAMVDFMRGVDFQARHMLLALKAGEPYRVLRALVLEAGYSAASGGAGHQRTRELIKTAHDLAQRIHNPHALALVTMAAGFAAFQEGHWKRSVELYERSEVILRERCTGVAYEIDNSQYYLLCSMHQMGEYKEVFGRLPALLKDARERGDLYAGTFLRIRYQYAEHLAADAPDRAIQELRQALEHWKQEGFQHQHYLEMAAEVQIALYSDSGLGTAAWKRIEERWPAFEKSRMLIVQVVRIEALHLKARCALAAAAAASDPEPLLLSAKRDALRIEREKMPWGVPLAQFIFAGINAARKNKRAAIELLASAEAGLEQANMILYAAAARRRRGELIGGDEGLALVEAADKCMVDQKIKNPDRMTGMLAQGKWKE